jgi:SPP1 gp7 family putative phage head morphogenesis protein
MARAYGDASERLVAELAALEERLAQREAAGEPLADAALAMRDRLEELISQLAGRLSDLSPQAVAIVSEGQQLALEWTNAETGQLVYASTGNPKMAEEVIRFDRLADETIQEFIGLSSDGSPLAVLFDEIAQTVPDGLRFTLSSGLAQGRNPRAVARDMRTLATLPQRRAETIARTEMLRASREAQRRMYEGSPAVMSYERVATQDARVCTACLALSGTVHKTDEIMPSHPNCRCVMVPKTPSLAEITGDPSIPDLRSPAVTPQDILRGLDREEIIEILGPGRYRLMNEGKVKIEDMVEVRQDPRWGPTTRIRPLSDFGIRVRPRLSNREIQRRLEEASWEE